MKQLETEQLTVTNIDKMLVHYYGNQSRVASALDVNRATVKKMIDTNRANVVLINDDGSYTLLK